MFEKAADVPPTLQAEEDATTLQLDMKN